MNCESKIAFQLKLGKANSRKQVSVVMLPVTVTIFLETSVSQASPSLASSRCIRPFCQHHDEASDGAQSLASSDLFPPGQPGRDSAPVRSVLFCLAHNAIARTSVRQPMLLSPLTDRPFQTKYLQRFLEV